MSNLLNFSLSPNDLSSAAPVPSPTPTGILGTVDSFLQSAASVIPQALTTYNAQRLYDYNLSVAKKSGQPIAATDTLQPGLSSSITTGIVVVGVIVGAALVFFMWKK